MIEKEPRPSWSAYTFIGITLAVLSVLAFVFGYLLRDWPMSSSRLSFRESLTCYLPLYPSRCVDLIASHGGFAPAKMLSYQITIASPLVALLLLGGFVIWFHYMRVKPIDILSGLTVGRLPDLLDAARYEQKTSKYPAVPGIHMFDGWHVSLPRETRHFNIIGAPGGGKTIIMSRMIHAAVERNDKVIIFDQKGDYTKIVPPNIVGAMGYEPTILSPTDDRSAVWDIARDLVVSQEAIELANRLVPQAANRFFSDSARAVLAVCIIKLMATNPGKWTWADLLEETRKDNETLLATALKYSRGTNLFLEADFKQVMSTRSTLEAHMGMLDMLATAWPSYEGKKLFSIREWLKDEVKFGTVIIKHDGQFSALSDAWISSIYAIAINTVTDSKSLNDDDLRRIWFFMDEWAQLPHINQFQTFVTVGRSKGICVVLGLQDAAQVSEKYGQDALKTLMASVGTTIIVQVNHGETALTLERYFGKTSYLEWKRKPLGTMGGLQWVDNRVEEAPFRSTEFSTLLGTDKHGVRCLVSGVGEHLYKVVVPLEASFTDKARDPAIPAEWTTTFKVDGKFATDEEIAAYIHGVKSRQKADMKSGD